MPKRVRTLKRLLFRLLLAASLLLAPLLFWAGLPVLHDFVDEGSSSTEVRAEAFVDDTEWEARLDDARPSSQAALRSGRFGGKFRRFSERAPEHPEAIRFTLVVDVRRIKPKRLFAPPYLRPRVVRLLS